MLKKNRQTLAWEDRENEEAVEISDRRSEQLPVLNTNRENGSKRERQSEREREREREREKRGQILTTSRA